MYCFLDQSLNNSLSGHLREPVNTSNAPALAATANLPNGFFQLHPIPPGPRSFVYSQTPSAPTSNLIAASSLIPACVFCNAEMIQQNLSRSTVRLPMSVSLPPEIQLRQQPVRKLKLLGTNELLEVGEPNVLISRSFPGNPSRTKRQDSRKFKNIGGLSGWYLKRRKVTLQAASASKMKQGRSQKTLKRLQTNFYRRIWKSELRGKYAEKESIRESKMEVLRRKGIKAPVKTECPLWNCPRKEYRRKRPFTALDVRARRSPSLLSNMSTRSRSPIVLREAR